MEMKSIMVHGSVFKNMINSTVVKISSKGKLLVAVANIVSTYKGKTTQGTLLWFIT